MIPRPTQPTRSPQPAKVALPSSARVGTLVVEVVSMAATYPQRKALGAYGERIAVRHLEKAGLRVVDRNWRTHGGEIDVVALDGRTLIVCEVKTRSSTRYGTPLEPVQPTKAARLHRLGWAWAKAHGAAALRVRVDVVCVLVPARGSLTVDHLVGVV